MSKNHKNTPPPSAVKVDAPPKVEPEELVNPDFEPEELVNPDFEPEELVNPDFEQQKPPYTVADGKCVTCAKGMLVGGQEIRPDYIGGGQHSLNQLVNVGIVVKN
jgi:hypothetical protein